MGLARLRERVSLGDAVERKARGDDRAEDACGHQIAELLHAFAAAEGDGEIRPALAENRPATALVRRWDLSRICVVGHVTLVASGDRPAFGFKRILVPQVDSPAPDPDLERRVVYYGPSQSFSPWVASIDADGGALLGVSDETQGAWRAICMLPRAALVEGERLFVACLDRGTVEWTPASSIR